MSDGETVLHTLHCQISTENSQDPNEQKATGQKWTYVILKKEECLFFSWTRRWLTKVPKNIFIVKLIREMLVNNMIWISRVPLYNMTSAYYRVLTTKSLVSFSR